MLSSISIKYLCDLIKITNISISDSNIFAQLILDDKVMPKHISVQYGQYKRYGHKWIKIKLYEDNSISITKLTPSTKYTLRINYHHISTIYHRDLIFTTKKN
jgi:hypothetical protein